MSNNKSNDELAEAFKALSNPNRLMLFKRLMSCCEPGTRCDANAAVKFCVGELGEGLNIAPSTLSHHLRVLNHAGLIQTERRGKNVDCWVEPAVLEKLAVFFQI